MVMRPTPPRSRPGPKTPLGFKLWFGLCAVVGLGVLGVGVWLAVALIGWLNRN